jgi:acid phosphatase
MSRSLLIVAFVLAVCIGTVIGHVAPHSRPHAHAKPLKPVHTPIKAADSYSTIMAYHEEPKRPPKPLYEAQMDVEDFHTGGGYDAELSGVISNAMLFASAGTPANNSVWVFDIDETSLSGYSEMLSIGFGYVPKLSKDWILSATAPAINQTLGLYQHLIQLGYRVVFLTGRTYDEADATATNLAQAGYTGYDTLIVRQPSEVNQTATVFKSNRRTILVEQEGYDVVGCIGDQWSDLHGPYTGYKVKLPNYIYWLP